MSSARPAIKQNFYPRSPCGERHLCFVSACWWRDFYPRSPCGERLELQGHVAGVQDFYPRSPCGERPKRSAMGSESKYFYPRSPCGERRGFVTRARLGWYFYPRSPCGERHLAPFCTGIFIRFLSTLSLRRATSRLRLIVSYALYFYPRSPCGERPVLYSVNRWTTRISIHALLAESDSAKMLRWESPR